ncbi:MAG: hypothetical protein D6682_08400 [Zetaproteobacteria bacterium]|nr:MAG: hypothetical protein D6682_08400 [Zetaproteobacteria bacterium]
MLGWLLLASLLPVDAAAAASGGDPARGLVIAQIRCRACHFLHRAQRRIGPGLLGVYGRAPTIDGVPFDRWDAAALDRWLRNPRAVKVNTTMRLPPLRGRDRADLIAWLRVNR